MTSVRRNLFDPDQLLQLAGEKVFKRGQGYADHGHIALLSVNGDGVFAAAFGTDDYTVWLRRPGPEISGHCSCPAYEDAGFCKHMVATALVANDSVQQGGNLPDKVGEIAARIAVLNKRQLENLLLEMATAEWRSLRSLCFSLDLGWDDDLD
ncbi:MAG: SWIM zinc finger family protein [Alphaproteobacteria bacterium]|nr:SWIM zinc finger family protein [Alphaproteobacteria bacterium]